MFYEYFGISQEIVYKNKLHPKDITLFTNSNLVGACLASSDQIILYGITSPNLRLNFETESKASTLIADL